MFERRTFTSIKFLKPFCKGASTSKNCFLSFLDFSSLSVKYRFQLFIADNCYPLYVKLSLIDFLIIICLRNNNYLQKT